jgi:RimJ/RimL family protein N-acetyltransferase
MPRHEEHNAHTKALSLNLDHTIFGSFAEIGAGQEVARWFLRVGGASGTVAKTISAYDKEVSDQLYGTGTRYVSKARLQAMLESEWAQLLAQLQVSRGETSRFFAFVDTVSARNYEGTNDCHGWLGLRFQRQPGEMPSEVILHINLRDQSNVQQQEAVGFLGVNLIYAVHHALGSGTEFLASLFEELNLHRIEIDCMEWNGAAFDGWERDTVHALLVAGGYAEAVAFPADGQRIPPNELLYKRDVVLAPGRFDTVTELHAQLIAYTLTRLPEAEIKASKGGLGLFCLSVPAGGPADKDACIREILKHTEVLHRLGYGVMLFRARELYTMSTFVNRYTESRIHFSVGLTVLVRIFEDSYADLEGKTLEGLARLFRLNVRLSVYPMPAENLRQRVEAAGLTGWRWDETDGRVTADNLHPAGPLDSLYQYLLESGFVIAEKPAPEELKAADSGGR